MEGVLRKRLLKKQQPITFEERLLLAFPGSEWAHTHDDHIDGRNPGPDSSHPGSIGVIGGAKFDEASLVTWLRSLPRDVILVTGNGRGSEAKVRELAEELGLRVDVPELRKDLFGTKAMDCQVEQVINASSPLVLIGTGGRVTKAKDWLKRANWGREVSEL